MAYVKKYPHKIWTYTAQYLHFRILEVALTVYFLWTKYPFPKVLGVAKALGYIPIANSCHASLKNANVWWLNDISLDRVRITSFFQLPIFNSGLIGVRWVTILLSGWKIAWQFPTTWPPSSYELVHEPIQLKINLPWNPSYMWYQSVSINFTTNQLSICFLLQPLPFMIIGHSALGTVLDFSKEKSLCQQPWQPTRWRDLTSCSLATPQPSAFLGFGSTDWYHLVPGCYVPPRN